MKDDRATFFDAVIKVFFAAHDTAQVSANNLHRVIEMRHLLDQGHTKRPVMVWPSDANGIVPLDGPRAHCDPMNSGISAPPQAARPSSARPVPPGAGKDALVACLVASVSRDPIKTAHGFFAIVAGKTTTVRGWRGGLPFWSHAGRRP
ncbi:hypothetical protein ERN12_08415 [Rhodobacteraceae bacterium]|nr:hypothetical protein ERN12_08415 [Paracoccaceae bacterium]